MAILKTKDIANMTEKERTEKIQDLRLELIKTSVKNRKTKS